MTATFAPAPPFTPIPTWSGVGAAGWDGLPCPDDLRLLSASSVPDALKSEQLERWKINETLSRLADRLPEFHARLQQDRDDALDWAKQLRFEPSADGTQSAADTGTDMHSLLECWLRDGAVPSDLGARINADPIMLALANNLWRWFNTFQPVAVQIEQVVYDPANGLAGRFDAKVTFKRKASLGVVLLDLKNSRDSRYKSGGFKKPYADSQALQLATYAHAPLTATFEPRLLITQRAMSHRVYLLNQAEQAVCAESVPVDGAAILHNTPERIGLYPMDVGPGTHRRALEAAGLHRWANEESRAALGYPVTPDEIELPVLTPGG